MSEVIHCGWCKESPHNYCYRCNCHTSLSAKIEQLESERDGLKLAINTQTDLYRVRLMDIQGLKAECENLLWNLAGCDTIAMGYGDGEFNKEMARPALYSVDKLARDRDKLKAELEAYKGYETWDHDGMREQLEDYKADRDRWKALAGKMAETLIKKIELHDSVKPKKLDEALAWRSNDELSDRLCNEALSAYQAALEGK